MRKDPRKGPSEITEISETQPEDDGEEQASVTVDLTQDAIRSVAILSEPDDVASEGGEPEVAPDVITREVITKESWSDDPSNRDPNRSN